jgi:hypothetical protein
VVGRSHIKITAIYDEIFENPGGKGNRLEKQTWSFLSTVLIKTKHSSAINDVLRKVSRALEARQPHSQCS